MMINQLIAIMLFILLLPIFVFISIIILIFDSTPIFYYQKRVGKNNVIFTMYKFRTMKRNTPEIATHLVRNPESLYTVSGRFLRKTSLDEIPQLLNIIIGDMVFIGPRPALYNQKDLISLRLKEGIDKMIPGITGWAQVNGRDDLSIKQKVVYEAYYLSHKSLSLDIKIILLTIYKLLLLSDKIK